MESYRSDFFDFMFSSRVSELRAGLARTIGRTQFTGFGEWSEPRAFRVSNDRCEPHLFWSNVDDLYGRQAPDYLAALAEIFCAEDPAKWIERRRWISQRQSPFFFSQQPDGLADSRAWFHLRRDFGKPAYHDAVAVRVPAPGRQIRVLVFASCEPIRMDQATLAVAAGTIYATRLSILDPTRRHPLHQKEPVLGHGTELKPRELEVMRWAAAGKSLQDISSITGLAVATVRYHLNQARKRYGYSTTQQTVVRAALDYELDPLGQLDPV